MRSGTGRSESDDLRGVSGKVKARELQHQKHSKPTSEPRRPTTCRHARNRKKALQLSVTQRIFSASDNTVY